MPAWSSSFFFLLLGLRVMVDQVTSCPSPCSCINEGNEVAIDCSRRGLTEIPTQNIDPNTKYLNMAGNQLSRIPAGILAAYPDVEELYFENNNIEVLEQLAFSGLKLKKLRLNGNRIQQLSSRTFKGIQGQCDLENFYFIKYTHVAYMHWRILNLTEVAEWPCSIDLRDNPITTVRSNAFSESQNYTLYLGQSNVGMTIETGAFADTNNILGVHIVNLPRLSLSTGTFAGMGRVGWIVIDQTQLSLTSSLFEGANSHPHWFRISNSNVLHLASNALTAVMDVKTDCEMVANPYGPNKILMYGSSKIEKGGIEIVNNTLPVLPVHLIKNSKIGGINFFGNRIAGFENGVFEREENQAEICLIRIVDNVIETIPSDAFQKIHNVIHIDISTSTLKSIEADAFSGSQNIGSLAVSFSDNEDNDQATIKANAFSNMRSVKVLSINRLRDFQVKYESKPKVVVEPFAFSGLHAEYMAINEIKTMQVLPDDLFSGLTVNQQLKLNIQNITCVHAKAFGGAGESKINRLDVYYKHNFPCDCETAKLNANLKVNIKTIEGLTCTDSLMMEQFLIAGLLTMQPVGQMACNLVFYWLSLQPSSVCK